MPLIAVHSETSLYFPSSWRRTYSCFALDSTGNPSKAVDGEDVWVRDDPGSRKVVSRKEPYGGARSFGGAGVHDKGDSAARVHTAAASRPIAIVGLAKGPVKMLSAEP